MSTQTTSRSNRFICWCGNIMLRFPWLLVLLATLACAAGLHYTINNLGVNTDTSELLSPDLPFQQNRFRWEKAFPQDAANILFVVEAPIPEQSAMAARRLAKILRGQDQLFDYVYINDDNPFFQQQAFLYLDVDELEDLAVKLSDAQPFIGYLGQNYHLSGLLEMIGQALNDQENDLPTDLNPLLEKIDQSIVSVQSGQNRPLSWQQLLAIGNDKSAEHYRHIVSARPRVDFQKLQPAKHALDFSHAAIQQIEAQLPGVNIRLTGEKALEQEELETLANDTVYAGLAALLLILVMLIIGLRSIKLVFATLIVLIMGLILTATYAALVVGHLNVLSVAFAVLYIGLGVDFAIHICLRYRECREHHETNVAAIRESVQSLSFSLFLCALTTSIGFFAYVPTDYKGVSELGLISGGGMFIGLLISLTILPALLQIMPVSNPRHLQTKRLPDFICTFPFHHALGIRIVSILLAFASLFFLSKLSFDSNPVDLRNPNSESVLAFKDLLHSKDESPFALISLTDNLPAAEQLAGKLQALPAVDKTITLQSFVAKDQEQKLDIIDELGLIFGTQLDEFDRPPQHADTRQALLKLQADITTALKNSSGNADPELLHRLHSDIALFIATADAVEQPKKRYRQLDDSILSLLPYTMQQLSRHLSAYPFTLKDLPDYLTMHWVSASGLYKIMTTPVKDLNSPANLREFVKQVQSIDASATGLPVGDIESGKAVVGAFIQAFSVALILITLLLLVILRSIRHTLLVIWPLLLAGLLTAALNVILKNPFNFANIIALPLLMGMGVDSGIHIMHRLHAGMKKGEHLLQTSTARGVFFSSLTTLCSFTSLAFTSHAGIASMGLLLAIGISFTLICTLIVLPAFSGHKIPL